MIAVFYSKEVKITYLPLNKPSKEEVAEATIIVRRALNSWYYSK